MLKKYLKAFLWLTWSNNCSLSWEFAHSFISAVFYRGNPSSRMLWNVWHMGYGTSSAASAGSVCPLKRWCSSSRESATSNITCALRLRTMWPSWWRWSIFKISFLKGEWLLRTACLDRFIWPVPSSYQISACVPSLPPCSVISCIVIVPSHLFLLFPRHWSLLCFQITSFMWVICLSLPSPYVELVNILLSCGEEVKEALTRSVRLQCEQNWGALCDSLSLCSSLAPSPAGSAVEPHRQPLTSHPELELPRPPRQGEKDKPAKAAFNAHPRNRSQGPRRQSPEAGLVAEQEDPEATDIRRWKRRRLSRPLIPYNV